MKEEIIKVAAERFAKYGFYKTTIEEIAADLNKVKSSLYYYFKTKEELFEAVIESALIKLWKSIKENVEKEKTPDKKLYAFIISHLQSFGKITQGYASMLDLYFIKHNIVQKVRENYDEKELDLIRNLLKEGNSEGIFDSGDVKTASLVIMTSIKGAEQEYVIKKQMKNVKIISEAMARMIIKSVSKEKVK